MFCPHSVFMCFVWISEQTAIISLYNINWLVFITERECVYCAVRTGSVVTVVTICTTSLTFTNSTFCPHTVFMCFVWISEQTAIISLYNINWLVCITERNCVYCAVRTERLNKTSSLQSLFMRRASGHCLGPFWAVKFPPRPLKTTTITTIIIINVMSVVCCCKN